MSDPQIKGMKAEIARLRKENDSQRETIDELASALASARNLCAQFAEALNKHRQS